MSYNESEGRLAMEAELLRIGLSEEILKTISYKSGLKMSLRNNLSHFEKSDLMADIMNCINFYHESEILDDIDADYRIKSMDSCLRKFEKYYPSRQTERAFNDILGFRELCDNYEIFLIAEIHEGFRIVDMSKGKAKDDGYRGVHMYYQLDHHHYPIEIQINTYYDRQFNNWMHIYFYKKNYSAEIGCQLRNKYECGEIQNESQFKEALEYVLSVSKEI